VARTGIHDRCLAILRELGGHARIRDVLGWQEGTCPKVKIERCRVWSALPHKVAGSAFSLLAMKRSLLTASALVFSHLLGITAAPAIAGPSQCDAVSGNLVSNCGFETGDLTGWTLRGDKTNISVEQNTSSVHSGYWGMAFQTVTGNGNSISQTLLTVPGTTYTITTWYKPNGTITTPTFLGIEWDGEFRTTVQNFGSTEWNMFLGGGTGTGSDTLTVVFSNTQSLSRIDDISVTVAVPAPKIGAGSSMAAVALLFGVIVFVRQKVWSAEQRGRSHCRAVIVEARLSIALRRPAIPSP
jgi:hypothetical protein